MWIFTIIVQPLIHILEFFYSVFFKISNNAGLSIVGLSFVITIFTLPLYMIAEKWQETEREIQERLKPGVTRIKETFAGDEQYLILSIFYKQKHYHPIMALRSSFSLLIQIPFFIAAYTFLSNLEALKGVSFLFVSDFGNPDATFHIGSLPINILPIAMTVINCVSGAIYSKGHPLSEKIQIYGCAAVFLLLLYNSPAGLVVYWTMNNIFSLLKNVFYKIKNPKKTLYIISCAAALFLIVFPLTPLKTSIKIINKGLMGIGFLIPFVPFIVKFFVNIITNHFAILDEKTKLRDALFFGSVITIFLLAGLCIPSMIVSSEPSNYSFVDNFKSPFTFITHTMFLGLGFFVFWPACFYELFSSKLKKSFAVIFPILAFGALINTFAFSGEYGALYPECIFMFEVTISVTIKEFLLHFLLMILIFALLIFLLLKYPKIVNTLICIVILSLSVFSISNLATIGKEFKQMTPPVVQREIKPAYHLSKTGQNVIVIMQDKLFSPFVNEIFNDFPEIKNGFDGFTYFPNTVSNGWLTMIGAPELFAGYDYTPYEMNKRTDLTLQEKHNQSLLSMPIIFNQAGFSTTVSNLPYENFLEYPVDSMYKDYPFITRANTCGVYSDLWYVEHNLEKPKTLGKMIKRNMIWFSIFKMIPPFMRDFIYYNEYWNSELKSSSRLLNRYIDNYSELDYLPELTDFSSDKNSFILLGNECAHDPIQLQYPDYSPETEVTSFGPSKYSAEAMYCTCASVLRKFNEFISYLKDNDVYDNTRIIIVSDHGINVDVDGIENDIPGLEKGYFISTLLVKDFNSRGDLKKDMAFMVNADTPFLATNNIIPNAKNPFTGNPLKVENKNDYTIIANATPEGTRARYKTKLDIKDDDWYYIKDNLFKTENWGKFHKAKSN